MKRLFMILTLVLLLLLVGCTKPSKFLLSTNQVTIEVGETTFLPITFQNLTIEDVTITASVIGVVEWDGLVLDAKRIGSTTLTVTYQKQIETIEVNVIQVQAHLSMITTILEVGKSAKITLLNFTDYEAFTWTISDPGIATLNEFYVLSALSEGTVTISLVLNSDPSIFGAITVNVIPVLPILYTSQTILEVSDTVPMLISKVAKTSYDDYDWEVSDPTVIQLNHLYEVTALKEGSSSITITHKTNNLVTTSMVLLVRNSNISNPTAEPSEGPLYVKATNGTGIVQAGEILDIEVLGQLDPYKYRYQSSDSTIVGITDTGKVFGIKEGIAKIHVISKKDSSIRGSLTVTVEGIPNVDYISRIIAAGLGEEGYVEGLNDKNKYGEWFEYPNVAWCAIFVSWCSNQAGIGIDVIPKYSSVSYGMIWFQEHGLFGYQENYTPKAGDIIFFSDNDASHTGIVVSCDGTRVYTIEGNTSGGVHQRSYNLTYSDITGYGTPNYPLYQP
ncbi:MAG: CHAP domain-containing protein [Bacilli bacterium]|nr:CHAP domain-containing protein [Bacilli bacterium]